MYNITTASCTAPRPGKNFVDEVSGLVGAFSLIANIHGDHGIYMVKSRESK